MLQLLHILANRQGSESPNSGWGPIALLLLAARTLERQCGFQFPNPYDWLLTHWDLVFVLMMLWKLFLPRSPVMSSFHFHLYPPRLLRGTWHSSSSYWNSSLGFYGTIVMVMTTIYIVCNAQCTVATDGVSDRHFNVKGRPLHDSVKTSGLEHRGSVCLYVIACL